MTFNWWTLLFETLNFVVLAYVLHRLLYRPLRQAIDQRRAANLRAQTEAEQTRASAEALKQQLVKERAELEQQRAAALHEAREQAERERAKLLAETEQDLQKCRAEHQRALERERDEAFKALRREVVTQAVELARRLLGEASDQTLHRQLVARLLRALREVPETERQAVRGDLQAGEGALLETAQQLDGATVEQVKKAVNDLAGKPISLAVQTKPGLLGGARLRAGGHLWDGSLSGQLPELRSLVGKEDQA